MDRLGYELGLTRDILENTNLSMWEMFRRSARRHPDRPAVRMGPEVWTYTELLDRALRSAAALQELGVTRGTRVGLLFHSCPEWAVLHYALARLGAVAVPINLAFQTHELRHALGTSEPELVIAVESFRGADFAGRLRALDAAMVDGATVVPSLPSVRWVGLLPLDGAERLVTAHPSVEAVYGSAGTEPLAEPGVADPWDPAYIVFTSGSTAFPKPALIAHRAFLGAATGFVHALDMRPEDSFLAMLPTFHVGGVTCVLSAPHLSGGCADLMGAFEAVLALRTIEQCRSTVTVGFDTMYTKMTGAAEFATADVSSLRKSLLACTPSYIDKLREIWEFDLFATSYGSTESGTLAAITPRWVDDHAIRSRTNGQPLPGVEFKIIDPESGQTLPAGQLGEICFRGWCRVLEYVGLPEENAAAIDDDGFFRSGDYGLIDADGYLHFRGRYKQMVKTGGENVSEREVEVFLEEHLDDVDFAQVVGVPDPVWGEAVVAFVSIADGSDCDSDRLRGLCKGAIAGYKIPKRFIGMRAEDFPVLANGRPDKSTLRQLAAHDHDGSPAHAR